MFRAVRLSRHRSPRSCSSRSGSFCTQRLVRWRCRSSRCCSRSRRQRSQNEKARLSAGLFHFFPFFFEEVFFFGFPWSSSLVFFFGGAAFFGAAAFFFGFSFSSDAGSAAGSASSVLRAFFGADTAVVAGVDFCSSGSV